MDQKKLHKINTIVRKLIALALTALMIASVAPAGMQVSATGPAGTPAEPAGTHAEPHSGTPASETGAVHEEYGDYLISVGFPESYVKALTDLHLLHPGWIFKPLKVTDGNKKYTWDHVIYMETDDAPRRSLISAGEKYAAYRHKTDTRKYDSGYFRASRETVEFFMDPRNFLNEKDIFQFQDLNFSDAVAVKHVETILRGTFMENRRLENGMTFAEYFYETGKELGINPLHLASRARQEQGVRGTGAQISGKCGTKLWEYYSNNVQTDGGRDVLSPPSGHTETELKSYDGLYNMFNSGAAGRGLFTILLSAVGEARKGTESKKEEWGSASWNTLWKSVYGGAKKLADKYIGNHQNTLYLQKWNVDFGSKTESGGSRNFWGQYMQNTGAALSEGRTVYAALNEGNCLDLPYVFVIPVYDGMPRSCPDPADGKCDAYAVSSTKYRSLNGLVSPIKTKAFLNERAKTAPLPYCGSVSGYSLHTCVIEKFEYRIDKGEWLEAESEHDESIPDSIKSDSIDLDLIDIGSIELGSTERDLIEGFKNGKGKSAPNGFRINVENAIRAGGDHTVIVRGKLRFSRNAENNVRYYLVAEILLSDGKSDVEIMTGAERKTVKKGDKFVLPKPKGESGSYFAGWNISSPEGRDFLPAGAVVTASGDTKAEPVYLKMSMVKGASAKIAENSALKFAGTVECGEYERIAKIAGAENISFGILSCETPAAGLYVLNPESLDLSSLPYKLSVSEGFCKSPDGKRFNFTGETDGIGANEYERNFSAVAYVKIRYSDSREAVVCTEYKADQCRSVRQVARAALARGRSRYADEELLTLEKLAK